MLVGYVRLYFTYTQWCFELNTNLALLDCDLMMALQMKSQGISKVRRIHRLDIYLADIANRYLATLAWLTIRAKIEYLF